MSSHVIIGPLEVYALHGMQNINVTEDWFCILYLIAFATTAIQIWGQPVCSLTIISLTLQRKLNSSHKLKGGLDQNDISQKVSLK